MKLRTNPAARQAKIRQRHVRQECLRRFQKGLERKPIALVVVLPVLVTRRRSDPDVPARGRPQVHAKPVSRRRRRPVDESVDERPPRRRQLRVLAAARIDREVLAPEQAGDVVGIQACRVDDLTCRDGFARRAHEHAPGGPPRRQRSGCRAGRSRLLPGRRSAARAPGLRLRRFPIPARKGRRRRGRPVRAAQ